ncbi:MAG: hypothetical protein Ct9H300mP1_33620 [Planctomycetaceae bacterium]|nr:MAG: hypothetical protein Ct9H300mP1_33620 [Planctomycetaceae bacterium]
MSTRDRSWPAPTTARGLVPADRQLADEQIKALIERDAVIGAAFDCWMIKPGLGLSGSHNPAKGTMEHIVDHIDHVCQIAGNARHAALGTDLDGGFGKEQSPADLETIADLGNIAGILARSRLFAGRYRRNSLPELGRLLLPGLGRRQTRGAGDRGTISLLRRFSYNWLLKPSRQVVLPVVSDSVSGENAACWIERPENRSAGRFCPQVDSRDGKSAFAHGDSVGDFLTGNGHPRLEFPPA